MGLREVTIFQAFCLFGAISAYRGADNRLVAGYQDERHQPEIEYHYPDMNNQISRQHLPAWHQPSQDSSPGPWRNKSPPTVGFVNHIKVDRKKPGHRLATTGMFRTSQWGTARIPYPGASVNVVPAHNRKKTYRGLVRTTVFSPDDVRKNQGLQESSTVADTSRALAQDEPASPDPCYRCPADRAVVAMKGTKFAPLEKPALKPCHQRSWSPEVKLELLSGIRPGFPLSEGAHVITARLAYRHKTLETCKFRYNVVVRRCPPLILPDQLAANCTAENAWGSECRFSCARGYQPLGFTVTECGDDQQWTQPLPHCTPASGCTTPPTPENGKLSCKISDEDNGDLMEEGTTCRYLCNEGFSLPNPHNQNTTITCSAGEWNTTRHINCLAETTTKDLTSGGFGADLRMRPPPQATLSDITDRRRHRKHRNGRPRSTDPCRPNPCARRDKCQPGPQPFLALCSCPDNLPEAIDGQPCHKMVLVQRLIEKKKKNRDVLVLGNVYGATTNAEPETEVN